MPVASRNGFDFRFDAPAYAGTQHRKIVARLHGEPELRFVAEEAAETQCGLWRNRSTAGDNLLDALRRDAQLERERCRGQAPRFEFALPDAAGVNLLG